MSTSIPSIVHSSLEGRRLLTHPFYRRWEEGQLTREELTSYAEQYRFFEAYLPTFLTELADQLDEGATRDAVTSNLNDETSDPSHLSLFDAFAASYGARTVDISPAMLDLINAYETTLAEGPAVAVAGLLAYEVQGSEIADSKREGLVRHYGGAESAIHFWTVHGSVEEDHAAWTMEGLEALAPDAVAVERGVDLVAEAWWRFLDERETLALV